jgi:hypothetical protein
MASTVSARSGAGFAGSPRRPGRALHRLRRIALVAAVVALLPAGMSYLSAMSGRSNSALGVRSVEWLRDHGAAGIVAQVEDWYYTLTAPSKGGPAPKAVPKVGIASLPAATPRRLPVAERPRTVRAMMGPALAGEGVWRPTRGGLGSAPPLLVTTLRDEPDYPRVFVGLAWMDTKRTQISLYAGLVEPTLTLPSRATEVPTSKRYRLLATFNSGFKLIDAGGSLGVGGYAIYGHTYSPLKDGLATFVGYKDGRTDIVGWSHGPTAPADVSYARQNLPLIVDHGSLNPAIGNDALWGATIANAVLVWRSGVGVDRHGNLIYAAGPDQTAASLAGALIRAGAVRAMELDINPYWVSFIDYGAFGALDASNLLPAMQRSATRYLTADDRDFFAVYLRK